ncbi:MAG: 6-O-methylguanine DNA methyltransferase [Parcubacteria group bacterium CG11_big_fil_rev_8_21_14_0_20_39_22]|nr:MAG: 6-O-methylguanine DNA methyltransferase [Parcubacteria group bacterium CG11_big_fil_rev_8_21_14_0_20_39_22]
MILTNRKKESENLVGSFSDRVRLIVRKIPRGKTLTYKEVARRAGSPKAFRSVGTILSKNYNKDIPCHRVIKSDGQLGNYNRGEKMKEQLLRSEGVV